MGWKKKLVKITSATFKVTLPEDYSTEARLTIIDAAMGETISVVLAGTEDLEVAAASTVELGAHVNPSLTVTVTGTGSVGKNLEIIVYG